MGWFDVQQEIGHFPSVLSAASKFSRQEGKEMAIARGGGRRGRRIVHQAGERFPEYRSDVIAASVHSLV